MLFATVWTNYLFRVNLFIYVIVAITSAINFQF
nr:MAG TPA: hypothetical protein [Caudoviricetes sp.]